MKGPSGRLKFDVRRLWECPQCRRRDYSTGQMVTRQCPSCAEPAKGGQTIGMHLLEGSTVDPPKNESSGKFGDGGVSVGTELK